MRINNYEDRLSENDQMIPVTDKAVNYKVEEVAIETSTDFSEPEHGFVTGQTDGIKYRLVTLDDEGYMITYLPNHRFFINKEQIQEYIEAHMEELEVISYQDMQSESIQIQKESQGELGQDTS
ncbi:MAG: hypothetical protein HDR13_07730 [Lachnospiraceae bacterium]|nr:hypothetical protein [Lachnospiraceae bacterium]